MRATKVLGGTGCAMLLASCVSPGVRSNNAADTWTAAVTEVEVTRQCSIGGPIEPLQESSEEGVGAIFAPFVTELGVSLVGALGAAISEAGAKQSEATISSPASVTLADFAKGREQKGGLVLPSMILKSLCVRTFVGTFEPGPATQSPRPFEGADFSTEQAATKSVETLMSGHAPGVVRDIHFYSEILLTPVSENGETNDYAAVPVITWYNQNSKVSRGRLVSMQLSISRPGDGERPETALDLTRVFEPLGLATGTLVVRNAPITSYTVVPSSPIANKEKQRYERIFTTVGTVVAVPASEGIFSKGNVHETAVREARKLAREETLATCRVTAEGKAEKLSVCEATFARRTFEEEILSRQRNVAAVAAIGESTQQLSGPAGHFNVSVKINETREANRYFTAIGAALTAGATGAKQPFTNYVGGQLGVTPDAAPQSQTAAENRLRSARFEYATAKSKYDAAVTAGETAKFEELLRNAIAKYGDLRVAYEALGQVPVEPAPY